MTENWIMVVGYDRPHFEVARNDWLKYNVYLQSVDTAAEAINQFRARQYLAVITSYNVPNMTPLIDFMGGASQIPLVILSQNDSGTKFAESIIRGADTFIIDPDKLIESIKENKDIIDRLAKMPSDNRRALGILTHRDIFMVVDYRTVFVHGDEVFLAYMLHTTQLPTGVVHFIKTLGFDSEFVHDIISRVDNHNTLLGLYQAFIAGYLFTIFQHR